MTPVSDFADLAAALEASCADLTAPSCDALQFTPNEHGTYPEKITAADCAPVHKAPWRPAADAPGAVRLQPLLDANTPSACGAGTAVKTGVTSRTSRTAWPVGRSPDRPRPSPVASTSRGGRRWTCRRPTCRPVTHGCVRSRSGPGRCLQRRAGDFSSVDYLTSPEITVGAAATWRTATAQLRPQRRDRDRLRRWHGADQQERRLDRITVVPRGVRVQPAVHAGHHAAGSTNPLQGQPGFTGTDGGKTQSDWGTSIINLSDPASAWPG